MERSRGIDRVSYFRLITFGGMTHRQACLPRLSTCSVGLRSPNQFFQPQEPGPSGLPQEPQGPAGIEDDELPLAETANTESCGSSFLLAHLGHAAFWVP